MEKFIVLGTQRTGSSAISKLINLHPNILCGLEWTKKFFCLKKISAAKSLLSLNFESLSSYHNEYVKKKFNSKIEWVGFKILFSSSDKWIIHPKFSPALFLDQINGHIKWIRKYSKIYVIHIQRNDNIDWLKSVFLAKKANNFSEKLYPNGLNVCINLKTAVSRIKSKNWVDSQIEKLDNSNPYLRIEYEAFRKDNEGTARKIMGFLNCDYELIDYHQYNAVRQSKYTPEKYIVNYTELNRILKSNGLI